MNAITKSDANELFRQPPERHLDVGEGEVAYRRVGQGPDVLFVHGWPLSGATFRRLLPHLADRVTCHIIDFPGAGSSRFDARTRISVEQHIETVRRVVDILDLQSVAAVGHDSGGLIARYALAGDPRLRSLGLLNTEQSTGVSRTFKVFMWLRRAPALETMIGVTARQPWKKLGFTAYRGQFEEFFLRPLYTSNAHRAAAAKLFRDFDLRWVYDLNSVHSRIDVPVRLVWGDSDPFFPIELARDMVWTFTNADIVEIKGATLMVHEERPAAVAKALLPVLT